MAQYLFSGFGTSVPIPHQSDTGFDLYATLTERRGKLSWPLYHYTVQVKSRREAWNFGTSDSVKWLVNHPHPLFLCVLNKKAARFSLFHTFPRFKIWAFAKEPARISLVPAASSAAPQSMQWDWPEDDATFSLGAPILEGTVGELSDSGAREHAKEVLKSWLRLETDNLAAVRMGLPVASVPAFYLTNQVAAISGGSSQFLNTSVENTEALKASLRRILPWLCDYYRVRKDLHGLTRAALLARYLELTVIKNMDTAAFALEAINDAVAPARIKLHEGIDLLSLDLERAIASRSSRPPGTGD